MEAIFFISDGLLGSFVVIAMLVNCVLGISFATHSGWKLIYSSWTALVFLLAIAILALCTPISYALCHISGGFSLILSVICFCNLFDETKIKFFSDKNVRERSNGISW